MSNKIDQLKSKIVSKDYILHGSIAKKFKKCGRTNCRCHENKKYWHGPYWIWTRKENGKTVTKTLNENQAIAVKKSIKEMKNLKLMIEKWKTESLKGIDKL